MGVIHHFDAAKPEKNLITWRHPLTFACKRANAAKIGDEYIVAGSVSVVDVINSTNGKIVHVFETKKDKIRSLGLLIAKGPQLYLLAEEERDGARTAAIILIELIQ